MSKLLTIYILDQINCVIGDEISKEHLDALINATKKNVEGGVHTAAYKIGSWDGKESQISSDGSTFVFMLDKIIPFLSNYGYDITLEDERPSYKKFDFIDDKFLVKYGTILRDYQVNAVNKSIECERGIVDIGTSGGKTIIQASIILAHEGFRSYTIVPSNKLVKQTYKTYKIHGIDAGMIDDKNKDWNKSHIVCTWQTFIRNKENINETYEIVLYDETHVMGKTMFDMLRTTLRNAHIRIGLTGSVPKNAHKKEKIMCHIGGDIVIKVKPKEMIDAGHVSKLDINMIALQHFIDLPDNDWETEKKYMSTNILRLETIVEIINNLPQDDPRLILCHPQFGEMLAKKTNLPFIRDETKEAVRESFYNRFDTEPAMQLIASYGTAGTGISINQIRSLVLIDIGKNYTRILQSIGRGLRLDGITNYLEVIDIYSVLCKKNNSGKTVVYGYSGSKHLKERIKIYKEMHYPYHQIGTIDVGGEK